MDLLGICENPASKVLVHEAACSSELQISESDIELWRRLFQLTRAEAIDEITTWRLDFGRETPSLTAWEAIKESEFVAGFIEETYKFACAQFRGLQLDKPARKDDTGMYLLRLEEPVPSLRTIQVLLKTDEIDLVFGTDDEGNSVRFCYMTAQLFHPAQSEYPVRYFFYGTLAERCVLARVLDISDELSIKYESAVVCGGALTTWANKYHGLVYWVRTRGEEKALRIYENWKI